MFAGKVKLGRIVRRFVLIERYRRPDWWQLEIPRDDRLFGSDWGLVTPLQEILTVSLSCEQGQMRGPHVGINRGWKLNWPMTGFG